MDLKIPPHVIINLQSAREDLLQGLKNCLRERVITSKYSYCGNMATKGWIAVCEEPNYKNYEYELQLLENKLPEIIKDIVTKKVYFVSLGIGNGEKDIRIIEIFQSYGKEVVYIPIDISEEMMRASLLKVTYTGAAIEAYVNDFYALPEIISRYHQPDSTVFLSILGNTLGNFPQVPIINLLRDSLESNDKLLIGVQMRKEGDVKTSNGDILQIIKAYDNETFNNFVFQPLAQLGVPKHAGKIEVEFGPNELFPSISSVKHFFRFLQDFVVYYEDEEFKFGAGERIQLYISHKYTESNIMKLLTQNGLSVEQNFIHDEGYFLFVCKKNT